MTSFPANKQNLIKSVTVHNGRNKTYIYITYRFGIALSESAIINRLHRIGENALTTSFPLTKNLIRLYI